MHSDYQLIDSGAGRKLERFGDFTLARPCAQAIWPQQLDVSVWQSATASFEREGRQNRWSGRENLPASWSIKVDELTFKLSPTDFGHLGIFPEQRRQWRWITETARACRRENPLEVLNLFAYSGGATLAAALADAKVCHLDASKGMVRWARENATLSGLETAPVRWIIEDVNVFLDRELKRGRRYDAIILDPPTYGHGRNEEVYKLESELLRTLEKCWALLSDDPAFVLLSSHTPYCTPAVLENLLRCTNPGRSYDLLESGEMLLEGEQALPLPSGTYARLRF